MPTPLTATISDAPRLRPTTAIVRERTEDAKLTADHKAYPISATMVSQHACPDTCPLMNNGCYAEFNNMGRQTGRLNVGSAGMTPEAIAEAEAAGIRGLTGQNPLRLHVVGDARTNAAAAIVAEAAGEHTAKAGRPVWTYTHAWRDVERPSWAGVSVLASCESERDAAEATARGYAVAMVAPDAASVPERIAGMKPIVCPQQAGSKPDCARCQICTKDGRLRGKAVVVFLAHGATRKVKAALASRQ